MPMTEDPLRGHDNDDKSDLIFLFCILFSRRVLDKRSHDLWWYLVNFKRSDKEAIEHSGSFRYQGRTIPMWSEDTSIEIPKAL